MHTHRSLSDLGKAGASSVPMPASQWKTRIALPLAIVLSAAALLGYAARAALLPALEVTAVSVVTKQVASVESGDVEDQQPFANGAIVQAPGWIEPEPFAVNVAALADGVIQEVLVLEGERIEAGQIIARMIEDDAAIALQAATATLAAKHAEQQAAIARVHTAQTEVAIEQATAAEIRDEVERKKPLAQDQTIPAGDFRRLELRLQAQEARVLAAQSAIAEAEARVAQAKADVDIADAMLAVAKLQLQRMAIRAPTPGIVLARLAEPGARMMTSGQDAFGAIAIRLYDPERLQVRVDIPLADAAKVGVGHEAQITTEALPDRVFTGRVTRLVQEANIQKNTMQVKVTIDEPSASLKPEMLARVRFSSPKRAVSGSADSTMPNSGALRVFAPIASLTAIEGERAKAWVIDEARSKATLRELMLGASGESEWREVRSGLAAGDRVIVNPPAKLTESTRVRIAEGWVSS